ncbi:MAG: type VI secretion system tip protein VgrG, partial [Amphritea sp.]|nr:type VI secretion system tip protein VgrG [Amphritea sp.]
MQTPYRPKRCPDKVPFIEGIQTATVTGPVGEEIYTDDHGRVKVQFHWDREGQLDENTTCWVRVSQNSAGGAFGSLFIPRIGDEVIVDFIEGNPDRPIITGRVYHGHNMPPYSLPEHKTRSTIKTQSTKDGEGYNEIRFEDRKGEEEIFIRAEKDLDQRTLDTHKQWVGNDHQQRVEHNEYREFYNEEHALTQGDYHREVKTHYNHTVAPDYHTQIGKTGYQHAGNGADWKAGQKILFEAGNEILIKAGGSTITINPAGVNVNGAAINLNGGGGGGSAKAAAPVAPEPPLEADLDQAGYVTEGKAAQTPWQPVPAFGYQDMVGKKSALLAETCTCFKG